MKRARFVAAARREFLAEVIYYNKKQPGLGSRFTEAVKEATVRALAFPLAGSPASKNTRRVFLKDFPLRLYIGRPETASLSSRSRITRVVRAIGCCEFRIASDTACAVRTRNGLDVYERLRCTQCAGRVRTGNDAVHTLRLFVIQP